MLRSFDCFLRGEKNDSEKVRRKTNSRSSFIVAGVTSQNQGFLGAEQFASMQRGSAIVLVSRAGVVDFDAMLEFAERGHIRFATDVYPQEPLPAVHPARDTETSLLYAHQAGALRTALKRIGKLVVADAELIVCGLPPVLCKQAQPETAASFILSGATAIGVGTELIPTESIQRRQSQRIHELARRFTKLVRDAREQLEAWKRSQVVKEFTGAEKCEK